jgi:hypothetical protein
MATYLSRIKSDVYRKDWEVRKCQFLARIVFPDKDTKKISFSTITILEISEGTAVFQTELEEFPKHFYIAIGKFQHYIGVALSGRVKENYKVGFIKEQPTKLIDALARIKSPATSLKDLSVMLQENLR